MELVVFWLVCGLIGAAILSEHNQSGTGCCLGIFLGPLGIVIAIVVRLTEDSKKTQANIDELRREQRERDRERRRVEARRAGPDSAPQARTTPRFWGGYQGASPQQQQRKERECPFCAELILARARKCKHCKSEVDPLES